MRALKLKLIMIFTLEMIEIDLNMIKTWYQKINGINLNLEKLMIKV